ncbi:MAG: putative polysaccharide biosynthesis protein [Lachnospiraceae bacterium]
MNKKKNNFIMQAGILAAAGIIVRIIGILYRSPLVAIIGLEGNGYYSTAYTIYTIILLISSYSIPTAVSKVIAERLEKKEYKNAHKIFVSSFYYVIVVGGIASLLCFFGATYLVGENSAVVLKVFAPTIFLSGILGVFRGYFQAHKSMIQTSFSQIIEQILNAIVSLSAAYILMQFVIEQDETTQAIYGAIGSALGTGAGVLIALLFMVFIYKINARSLKRKRENDNSRTILTYRSIYKIILLMVTPVIFSTFIYNFSTSFNLKIYCGIVEQLQGFSEAKATTNFGIFSGMASQIINIPIAIASAMSAAIIPTVAASYQMNSKKQTNLKIKEAISTTMLIAIPSFVGLFILAKPIVQVLYPQPSSLDLVASLVRLLSISVVFYSLSTLTNAILQGTGNVNRPVIHAAVSLIIQGIVLVVLLLLTSLDLYALGIVSIVYSFLMTCLNAKALRKKLGYKQEIGKTFVLPFIASIGMGISCFIVYYGLVSIVKFIGKSETYTVSGMINIACLVPTIAIAIIIYFVLLIKLEVLNKKRMEHMPFGNKMIRIATILKLIKM